MVTAILSAIALITIPQSSCRHLSSTELDRLIAPIRIAPTFGQRLEAVGALQNYWRSTCKSERAAAPPAVVVKLAQLLWSNEFRFAISSVLFDVGPNLAAGKSYLDDAITDDRRAYSEAAKQSPVISNGNLNYRPMMCLKRKIESGMEDPTYCWTLKGLEPPGSVPVSLEGPPH